MKSNPNYTVDFPTKTIIVTKAFNKRASIYGSEAYEEMRKVCEENPAFKVACKTIEINATKKTHSGLTYIRMEDYITLYAPDSLSQFEQIKRLSKVKNGEYAFVKKWFLNTFPNYDKQDELPRVA